MIVHDVQEMSGKKVFFRQKSMRYDMVAFQSSKLVLFYIESYIEFMKMSPRQEHFDTKNPKHARAS